MITSFKFHFRPSIRGERSKGKLFIRIICKRKYKNLRTCYSVFPDEWNEKEGRLVLPDRESPRFYPLKCIEDAMQEDLFRLKTTIDLLKKKEDYTVDDIVRSFNGLSSGDDTLLSFSTLLSWQLHLEGRVRTARAYLSSVRSLMRFNGGDDVKLSDITPKLLKAYEESLIRHGLYLNTVSFYMRNLRAIFRRAICKKILSPPADNPFANVYTGVAATVKRALDKEEINRFAQFDKKLDACISRYRMESSGFPESVPFRNYEHTLALQDSLMYFMFCFYARGMSYVDMVYLQKNEIHGNKIVYVRKKTGQELQVKITEPMRRIIKHFSGKVRNSPYVFPIINPVKGDERHQYETGLRTQNERLKVLSGIIGLKKKVTTHVSRHSWATLAKRERVDVSLISEALGHANIKTTIMYLDSFEDSRMDLLSERISGIVKFPHLL